MAKKAPLVKIALILLVALFAFQAVFAHSEYADVIITFKDGVTVTKNSILASNTQINDLNSLGIIIKEKYPIINGAHVLVPKSKLDALKNSPYIQTIEPNELRYHIMLNTSGPLIGADKTFASGYDGSGVKVCILDTGIDFWHQNLPTPANTTDFTNWDWCIDNIGHPSIANLSRSYNFSLNISDPSIDWLQVGVGWLNESNRYDIYVYYPNGTLANATIMSIKDERWDNASNTSNYTMAHNLTVPGSVVVKNGSTILNQSNYTVYYNEGKIILTEPSYVGENLTIDYSYKYPVINDTANSGLYFVILNLTNTTQKDNWTIVLNETDIKYGNETEGDWATIFWGENVTKVATYYDFTNYSLGLPFGCSINSPVGIENRTFANIHSQDDNGHGTHVAGIIASNDSFYRGIAPNVTLYIAKVFDSEGYATTDAILDGIDWCINNNVSIMIMSFGAPDTKNCNYSDVWAIDEASEKGILSVVAAGNYNNTITEPGCSKTALTVGATYDNDTITYFSGRGPTNGTPKRTKPDIVAPGYDIISTYPTNDFASMSGTSMAVPHVAGVAALLKQKDSSLTASEIKAMLMASSNKTKLFALRGDYDPDNTYGTGRVDALKAVNSTFVKTINITGNSTVRFKINVTNSSNSLFVAIAWNENLTEHSTITLSLIAPNSSVVDSSTNPNNTIQQVGNATPTEGIWTLEIKNLNSTNRTVSIASTYDLYQAPEVLLISPQNNYLTNETLINFTYQVNSTNIDSCSLWGNFTRTWQLNQTNTTPINTTGNNTFELNLTNGIYIWNVYCNDTNGKIGLNGINYTLKIDTEPPIIEIYSPVDNYNTSANLTLNWSVIDVSFSKIWYSINNSANITGSWSNNSTGVIIIPVVEGIGQNITVYANDSFGRINSTTKIFNIDRTPPNLTLLPPTNNLNNSVINNNTFDINYTASDNYALSYVWYVLNNGTPVNITNGNKTVTLAYPGRYVLNVYANDSAGNINSTSVIFIADFNMNMSNWTAELKNKAPEIELINITLDGIDITNNESTSINGTVQIFIKTANFNITFTNFTGFNARWENQFNITENSINVTNVINSYGTNLTKLVQLIGVPNFLDDADYNGTVTFLGNSSNFSQIFYCEPELIYNLSHCSLISVCNSTFNGTACYNESADLTTVYVPHFSAIAIANDTIAPVIIVNSPTNNTTYNSSADVWQLKANLTTSPDTIFCNMSLLATNYSSNLTTSTNGSSTYVWQIGPLRNGVYNITFYCKDNFNNWNNSTIYFNVSDLTRPNINVYVRTGIDYARISWSSDEPINVTINYGKSASLGKSEENTSYSSSGTIELSSLDENTIYYYNFTGCDYCGNCQTKGTYNFTTEKNTTQSNNQENIGGGGNQTSNATSKTQIWDVIQANVWTIMNIDSTAIPVTKIIFKLISTVQNVGITVKDLGTNASKIGVQSAPDVVYRYFQITASPLINNNLNLATIKFRVPKSYFENNNLNASTVTLYNNNGTGWEKLLTVLKDNTGDYNTYEANTTHFSVFAITTKPNENVTAQNQTNQTINQTFNQTTNQTEIQSQPQTQQKERPYPIYIVIAVLIAVIVAVVWLIKTKFRKG